MNDPCPVCNGCCPPSSANACLAAQMVQGVTYTFRFGTQDILKVVPTSASINSGLQGDANFGSASAFPDSKGVTVTFVYQGRGSTISGAASEMQSVLNDNRNFVSGALVFTGASLGAADPRSNSNCCSGPSIPSLGFVVVLVVVGIIGLILALHEANS